MTRTRTRDASVLLVAVLVVSSMAGAAAAASLDTSTTDATSTTSDLASGDTVVLNATTNQSHTIEAVVSNSTTPAVRFEVDGTTYERNTSMLEGAVGSEGTHWTGNISEAALLDVPIDAGGNVSANLVVYNASNSSDVLVNTTIYLESDGTYATTSDGDEVQTENTDDGLISNPLSEDTTPAAGTESSTNVTANTTMVRYAPQNASMKDAVGAAVSNHDSDLPLWTVQMKIGEQRVPVVAKGTEPPEWVDEDEDAYGVAHSDGTVVVHNTDFDGSEEVTLVVVGNEQTNYLTQADVMMNYGVGMGAAYWQATGVDYNGNPENVELAS